MAAEDEPKTLATAKKEEGICGFIVCRILSLAYCTSFISLLAQVDGLFGCDSIYPPKAKGPLSSLPSGGVPLIISLVALLGALLSGAAVLAVDVCERHCVKIFCVLWVCFAGCVDLAPAFYPQLEDKLLLETGLVGLFLAARGSSAGTIMARDVGRGLAAWLLFRSFFSSGAGKVTGDCGAWRDLSALRDVYQLEAFPLPTAWLLHMAPSVISKGLTFLQLYTELVLCPMVVAPCRALSRSAALSLLLLIAVGCSLANKGCAPLCQLALVLSLFDDTWHRCIWSEKILASWGYKYECEEQEDEEMDEDTDADVAKEDDGAMPTVQSPQVRSLDYLFSVTTFVTFFFMCFLCSFYFFTYNMKDSATDRDKQGASEGLHWFLVLAAGSAAALSLMQMTNGFSNGLAAASRFSRFMIIAVGALLWIFGLVQLSMDCFTMASWPAMKDVAAGLERFHIAHAYGRRAEEVQPCPRSEGRLDLLVQGSGHDSDFRLTGRPSWISLSSRFLPTSEERRPIWMQPYVPRLDKELWRLAQQLKPKKSGSDVQWGNVDVPKWITRLMTQLGLRKGAGARLSAGAWDGLSVKIHGPPHGGQYQKLPTPLHLLTLSRTSHHPVEDPHSNKWWKRQEAQILKVLEEKHLRKLSKKYAPKCEPLPWAELPVSEALTTLMIAAWVGRICTPMPKKRSK